jgi:tetratricopeptide (TPR) repeat protein
MNDIKIIEKYLDGEMTTEEKLAFEERCKADKSLHQMLTEMNALVEGIRSSGAHTTFDEKIDRLALVDELNRIETIEEKTSPVKIIPFYQRTWSMAAAASLILAATLTFYFVREQAPRNEKLYISYFEVFDSPGPSTVRGDTNDPVTTRSLAYLAYDSGNYADAAKLFEKILKDKEDPIMQLCLGNAYLSQNDPARAEKVFTRMLNKHIDLITQARWYLALSYLKQNKIERTKATLWEISKSSTYGEKARKLLNELD